ncbi:MAG: LPXTG cell wall anchor domain-containing protein [Candidatus Eremiobacteraeota bacterium]|nr:LPXTG cell wall anchor domain-containing protein [Candidatus Eremiobacteraeota bacterium]MCW5866037.1 LPXTG cell wall anchor domain-containing protein [Candidatus Eremiobacteraeota bacterium]
MKKALLATAILMSSVCAAPAVYAQDSPSYSNTVESTPTPVEKTDVNVNVEAPPTEVVQAPAPDVNVHVDNPSSVAVPSTSTEKTTRETSVTRIVQTPTTDDSSNMAFLLVGGGIAALAVAGLFASTRR